MQEIHREGAMKKLLFLGIAFFGSAGIAIHSSAQDNRTPTAVPNTPTATRTAPGLTPTPVQTSGFPDPGLMKVTPTPAPDSGAGARGAPQSA
jgi:hypothetical protein